MTTLSLIGMLLGNGPARADETSADRRVALVIGNARYDADGPLSIGTAANDANEIAAALERLNFKVIRKFDLDWNGFDSALTDFQDEAAGASVGLVFYAGHAMHRGDESYLIPLGATLDGPRSLAFRTIALGDDVIGRALRDVPVKIVILDASRENGITRQFAQKFGPNHDPGGANGLGPLPSGDGLLVAYDAAPGAIAGEGSGPDSLYARSLSRRLNEPGIDLRALLDDVAKDVRQASKTRQQPAYAASPSWPGLVLNPGESDEKVWGEIAASKDIATFEDFISRFPKSPYRPVARDWIDLLKQAAARDQVAKAAREQAAKEQAARELAAKELAAKEQAAKEQAAKAQAAKEQAAKEQAAKELAAKELAAKEQAAKEQAAKAQAAKEQAAKELAAKELAAKEQAAREQAAKAQAAREQAARDQAAKELAEKELAAKEQAAREQAAKAQAAKDQAAKAQAAREQAAKEQAAKELAAKELAAKEQAAKEQAAKAQAAREQAAKDQAAKELAAKEEAAREQAAKAQTAKEQAAREQPSREKGSKERAAKLQAAKERAAREADARRAARAAQARSNVRETAAARPKPQAHASEPAHETPHAAAQGCIGCGF